MNENNPPFDYSKPVLMKVSGEIVQLLPLNRKTFSLEELQGFVGGTIFIAGMPSGLCMVGHDEGKLIGLPANERASELWREEYPIMDYPHNNDGLIVGDVLVTPSKYLN